MKTTIAMTLLAAACVAGGPAVATAQEHGAHDADQEHRHNTLTAAEREAGWVLLFDGESLDGWRRYDGRVMTDGWSVVEGALMHTRGGGDIYFDRLLEDFELRMEWRVEEGGNSGIFYRAALGEEHIYHSAPEMQVLDDERHRDGQDPLTSAGANYGLNPAPRGVVNPAGEWNSAGVVVRGNRVEHWLNGQKIVDYELHSDEWKARVAGSKFSQWPPYGMASSGYIGLQDHGNRVWFRNLKLLVIG